MRRANEIEILDFATYGCFVTFAYWARPAWFLVHTCKNIY